jgi:hypothetical protein
VLGRCQQGVEGGTRRSFYPRMDDERRKLVSSIHGRTNSTNRSLEHTMSRTGMEATSKYPRAWNTYFMVIGSVHTWAEYLRNFVNSKVIVYGFLLPISR